MTLIPRVADAVAARLGRPGVDYRTPPRRRRLRWRRQQACSSWPATPLVVPTYNRPALLKRLVTFYARETPAMKLLVLDSSRPEVCETNAAMIAAFPGQVEHRVFPGTLPMAAKLRDGLAQVETPTASFCADDDLVFPQGIAEAIAFLESAPDHVSAHGLYVNFGEHGHQIHVMREYAGPSNAAAHPGARVFRLCQNYESIFYGVFRTPDIREVFEGVAALPSLHFQELFQSAALLLKGKVKRIERIYAARRSGEAAEPDRDRWQTYYWFADNPAEIATHYVDYREHLWRFAQAHGEPSNFDATTFARAMDLAHAIYFSKGCPPAYFHSVLQPLWPDDRFVKQQDDLFRAIGPTGGAAPAHRRRTPRLQGPPSPAPGEATAPRGRARGGRHRRPRPQRPRRRRHRLDTAPRRRPQVAGGQRRLPADLPPTLPLPGRRPGVTEAGREPAVPCAPNQDAARRASPL